MGPIELKSEDGAEEGGGMSPPPWGHPKMTREDWVAVTCLLVLALVALILGVSL